MLDNLKLLFPAHAGVIPLKDMKAKAGEPFPRTRGGDPRMAASMTWPKAFSPHTRG